MSSSSSSDPPRLDSEAPPDEESTSIIRTSDFERRAATVRTQMHAYLVVLAGSNVGEMYRLEGTELVVGRALGSTIRLFDDGISRRHARLSSKDGQILIQDLGSANGTLVNGEHVAERALKDGDKIQIGSTTILKFTYHDRLDETFQQKMYDAALRDGMTRTFNKRYFSERLDAEFAYARRHQAVLSLVMFDVDHFKRINDTWGHQVGDYVLVKLATVTQTTIRTEDILARYGGEEFAIICRGVTSASAAILGERIRSAVERSEFVWENARLPVAVSVGVAGLPDASIDSTAGLVAAADHALYEAKRAGRNRVVVHEPPR